MIFPSVFFKGEEPKASQINLDVVYREIKREENIFNLGINKKAWDLLKGELLKGKEISFSHFTLKGFAFIDGKAPLALQRTRDVDYK